MHNISIIWQTIHQLLSDPITQLIVPTGISIILAQKASPQRPHVIVE